MARRVARQMDNAALASVYLLVAIVVLFLLIPVALVVVMSFDSRDYMGAFPPPSFTLHWYRRFFDSDYFIAGLKYSLILATATAIISSIIGVLAAVAIDRASTRIRELLSSLFLSPLVVPGVVIGVALLLFYARVGIANGFVRLLFAHVLITFPYALRTSLASISGIRRTFSEAAWSLGANERQAFWTVTFPLARAGIAAGAVFAFAFSFDDVAATMFLSDSRNYTLPIALVSMIYSNLDLTIASAAVLQVLVSILLIILLDRTFGLDKVVGLSTRAR